MPLPAWTRRPPLSSITGAPGRSNAWGWSRDSRALQTWPRAIPTAQGSVDPPLQTFPSDGGTSVHRLAAQVVEEVEEITARPARLDCDLQVRNLRGARPGAGLRESAVPRGSVRWCGSVSARVYSSVKIFGGSASWVRIPPPRPVLPVNGRQSRPAGLRSATPRCALAVRARLRSCR